MARIGEARHALENSAGVTVVRYGAASSAGTAATVEAGGVLDSGSGAVPIGFVFLQEAGRLRILAVSLAGVPVLQE